MPPENNNTIEHKQNIDTSQKIEEKFLVEEEKLNKLKNSPELYKRWKEELEEYKNSYKNIKLENIGEINNIKKEFWNDIRWLINISKIAPKEFREELWKDLFTNEQEEKLYDLFKKKKRFIWEFIKFNWKLPESKNDFNRFIEDLEVRKELKKEYKNFKNDLWKIDFSVVSKKELLEYIEQIKKYEWNIDLSNINEEKYEIKKSLEQKQREEEQLETDKEEEKADKEEEKADKKEEKARENIKSSNSQLEKFKDIYKDLKWIDWLEDINKDFSIVSKLEPLKDEGDFKEIKNEYDERLKKITELELKIQKNAWNIVKAIIDKDEKNWKIKKDSEWKIISIAPDSIYNKLIPQFINISPLVKQAFKPFLIDNSPIKQWEIDIIDSISGWKLDVSKMKKIGDGKYMFDGKEFDISENWELTTYSVDECWYKIELWNISKDDLEPLEDAKWELSEKHKRLKNLWEEYNNKLIELEQARKEKPINEEKINRLETEVAEKKRRIGNMVKEIDKIKIELKEEKQKLSNFITKDKLKKVEKSQEILNDTGLTRFFPQSVIDEIFARINLSSTLREQLWIDTNIDLSEWELWFKWVWDWEYIQKQKFSEFVNSMISWNKGEPLDISEIKIWNIWYWKNELDIKTQISTDLVSWVIWYDIPKILDNVRKWQLEEGSKK